MPSNLAARAQRLRRPWLIVLTAITVVAIVGAVILRAWAESLIGAGPPVRYSTQPPSALGGVTATYYASDAALLATVLVAATLVGAVVAPVRWPR